MYTKDFIQNTFIIEMKQMTIGSDGMAIYPYIGFSLVCQSVEVLGACFDEYEWGDRYLSELRFRLAIKKLFPKKYQEFNGKNKKIDLYKNLRCPMVHQMRPGKYIGLSEKKHEKKAGVYDLHLKKHEGRLILIYENFYEDFHNACEKIINFIESGEIKTQKVLEHNISVPTDI